MSWWRDGVLDQIYPRSFADSNGDGIGVLRDGTDRARDGQPFDGRLGPCEGVLVDG